MADLGANPIRQAGWGKAVLGKDVRALAVGQEAVRESSDPDLSGPARRGERFEERGTNTKARPAKVLFLRISFPSRTAIGYWVRLL